MPCCVADDPFCCLWRVRGQDRLKALKEHDTEAYYNLLKEHKNEKILNVLTETDKYLKALGLAVLPSLSRARLVS